MGKYKISDRDYLNRLTEQRHFLISDIKEHERGKFHFGVRIASTLRTIFHDTGKSVAILPALAEKYGQQLIFKERPNAYAFAQSETVTLYLGFQVGHQIIKANYFDGPMFKDTDFDTYWNAPVYKEGSIVYTRRQMILFGANKFGGAHVDPKIPEKFLRLVDGSGPKLVSVKHGEEIIVNRVAYETGIQVVTVLDGLVPKLDEMIPG